jgi:hypothetical protein
MAEHRAKTDAPYRTSTVLPPEPSISDALARLIEAGQRVVSDRLDLIRLDLAHAALIGLRGVALIAAGAVLLGGAWIALLNGVALWLGNYTSLPIAFLSVTAVSAVSGTLAVAMGMRKVRARALERVMNLGALTGDGARSQGRQRQ